MYKILMIGPDSSRASGGMASVIRSLSKSETLASRFTILEFPSCKDGSLASRLFFTGVQYMHFIIKPLKADICHINQMIISKNPQFTGISARQQLEFTTHLLLTD